MLRLGAKSTRFSRFCIIKNSFISHGYKPFYKFSVFLKTELAQQNATIRSSIGAPEIMALVRVTSNTHELAYLKLAKFYAHIDCSIYGCLALCNSSVTSKLKRSLTK